MLNSGATTGGVDKGAEAPSPKTRGKNQRKTKNEKINKWKWKKYLVNFNQYFDYKLREKMILFPLGVGEVRLFLQIDFV